MPARGGEADLTDPELKSAILYMFDPKYSAGSRATRAAAPGGQPNLGDKGPNHAVAGNVEVFLGIVAAQSLLSYPPGSAERAMHGGVPKEPDAFHLNVSLQDRVTQQPITGASVTVQIEPAGSTGTERATKSLEPIPFGAASYGNYVHFKRNTPYIVTVRISTPTSAQPVEARFEQTLY
jgi:hypothetical protein